MGSSLTIVAIIGLALVPQASYAEEANNTCVAGLPCGEAILAAFVAEDCKAAITKTKFYNVKEKKYIKEELIKAK